MFVNPALSISLLGMLGAMVLRGNMIVVCFWQMEVLWLGLSVPWIHKNYAQFAQNSTFWNIPHFGQSWYVTLPSKIIYQIY